MPKIELLFTCGHKGEATGNEDKPPVCPQDGSPIDRVTAPKPNINIIMR